MTLPPRPLRHLAGFVLVAGVFVAGARLYLSSGHATERVAARLHTLLGVPVRIAAVDIGLRGGSSLHGLQVYESAAASDEKPWLTVAHIQADVTALDLLGAGALPHPMQARDARINLHFDDDGHLLTRLPRPQGGGPIPPIHLDDGQVTLNQAGRSPMVVTGVTVDLTSEAGGLGFAGTVADPYWGDWTVTGVGMPDGAFHLVLKTPRAVVTQEKLLRLPFVSPKVWQQVELEGLTPVDFTLRIVCPPSAPAEVSYRVELAPVETRVYIPSIDLRAEKASGRVIVENKQVELYDVRGRGAGGLITTQALLDFRQTTDRLQFAIGVEQLEMNQLPRAWRWPSFLKFDGRLSGQADLLVTVNDRAWTTGRGTGQITQAHLFGMKLLKPLAIELRAEGDHFQWSQRKTP